MDTIMRDLEMFHRKQEDKAGFVIVHPDDWPQLRAGIEAKGIAVYEDAERSNVFYLGGWKTGSTWRDPQTGERHSRTVYTGTRCYLSEQAERGKIMTFTPPANFGDWQP